jgi:hypothetical protein
MTVLLPPIWTGHADFTNPFEFATFMRMADGLEFDVMMEGKSRTSLLNSDPICCGLRPTSPRRFGICPDDAAQLAADEQALEAGVRRGRTGRGRRGGNRRAEALDSRRADRAPMMRSGDGVWYTLFGEKGDISGAGMRSCAHLAYGLLWCGSPAAECSGAGPRSTSSSRSSSDRT